MRFKTVVLQPRKNVTGIEVPDDVIAKLGAGKRPAVSVTLKKYTYRTTVGVMGGKSLVPLSTEVPLDLATAMKKAPGTREFFDSLAASYQKEWVHWIEDAKKEETRLARVAKAVEGLAAGKKTH